MFGNRPVHPADLNVCAQCGREGIAPVGLEYCMRYQRYFCPQCHGVLCPRGPPRKWSKDVVP